MAGKHKRKASSIGAADPALPEVLQRARRLRLNEQRTARLAAFEAGQPTPEQQRQNVYETVKVKEPGAAAQRLVKRNITGMAIDRYVQRGWLSDRQHRSATRYRETYERGGFERSLTSRYSPAGGSSPTGPNQSGLLAATHNQIDARMAFGRARDALPASLASRFDRIVLHEDDAGTVGIENGKAGSMAARMAVEWVRICCDELASYYRL
jgi:hypothetical protein